MDSYKKEIAKIQEILKENPKGMTVTDISRKIKINRNSVAKYLDIMRISGQVEMITFGPAKVFFPAKRIPISKMLNYTSDYIVIFDKKLKISLINDSFLDFLEAKREELLGGEVTSTISNVFEENNEIALAINEALEGKTFKKELDFKRNGENLFFKLKIIPTTFEDGKHGVALIINDQTDHKIAEQILRESEENFKSLLKRINKE